MFRICSYAPKPPAAPAANIRVTVPSYNKDRFAAQNDTIMFNIPSGKRGQYMNPRMSYLTFDLEVECDMGSGISNHKPILALDGGAHSLIQHLEVYHGSNLLVSSSFLTIRKSPCNGFSVMTKQPYGRIRIVFDAQNQTNVQM